MFAAAKKQSAAASAEHAKFASAFCASFKNHAEFGIDIAKAVSIFVCVLVVAVLICALRGICLLSLVGLPGIICLLQSLVLCLICARQPFSWD